MLQILSFFALHMGCGCLEVFMSDVSETEWVMPAKAMHRQGWLGRALGALIRTEIALLTAF